MPFITRPSFFDNSENMTASPVALILGAGANIGHPVGRAFAAKGYKIALVARSLAEEDSSSGQLHIQSDFGDAESVVKVFAKVEAQLGLPSVVVYNGISVIYLLPGIAVDYLLAAVATINNPQNPLGLSLDAFNRDFVINTTSAFIAAQQAVLAFEKLPESAPRTFIYTGNILNTTTMGGFMTVGVGKSATAHIIESAAKAYKEKGYKFALLFCNLGNGSLTRTGSIMSMRGR